MPTTTGISMDGIYDLLFKVFASGASSNNKKYTLAGWAEVPASGDFVYVELTSGLDGSVIVFSITNSGGGLGGIGSANTPLFTILSGQSHFVIYEKGANTAVYATKYFFMISIDTTQAVTADRCKMWYGPYGGAVVEIKSTWTDVALALIGTPSALSLNDTFDRDTAGGTVQDDIGCDTGATSFTGKYGDIYFLDGIAAADPSSFVTNYATAAVPGTYSGSYGSMGYHLDFSNAGSLGADSSGNGNNWSTSGGPTQLTGYFAAGGSNKTLSAAAGSYGVTGSTAGVKRGRKVGAAAGSFTWNGVSASLLKSIVNKTIAGGAGGFTYTGATAGLKRAGKIAAGAGSFGITGSPATLRQARKLAGGAGSFALSGVAATLLRRKGFTAVPGSYGLTGAAAAIREMKKLAAGAGSYGVTGANAGVLYSGKRVIGGPGAYAWNGVASGILVSVDGETREPWQFSPFFEPLRGI